MAEPATVTTPLEAISWYRRLYHRVQALSTSRYALAAMLVVAFVDASFFPVPPFALLIPMVLAAPHKWVRYSVLGTVFSLLGGLVGYYVGTLIHAGALSAFAVDLNFRIDVDWRFISYHATVSQLLADNFWALALLCSVLPTPFKVVAIGSGMVSVPLGKFMLAAVIGRSARFFGIAGAMALLGPRARKWFKA